MQPHAPLHPPPQEFEKLHHWLTNVLGAFTHFDKDRSGERVCWRA